MKPHDTDRNEEFPASEASEGTEVPYSWANLHGVKYRDFSASRREYRAQLRHRAAQQVREQALLAQAEAEAAAAAADSAARQAEAAARSQESESSAQRSLLEAEEAFRTAAAERLEAARRAEIATVAEVAARREEREIADSRQSVQRPVRYADSEMRRISLTVPQASPQSQELVSDSRLHVRQERRAPVPPQCGSRLHAYGPDGVAGVRPIYREPGGDILQNNFRATESEEPSNLVQNRPPVQSIYSQRPHPGASEGPPPFIGKRHTDPKPSAAAYTANSVSTDSSVQRSQTARRATPHAQVIPVRQVSPFSQMPAISDSGLGRSAQDDFDHQQSQDFAEPSLHITPDPSPNSEFVSPQRPPYAIDPAGPTWLYAPMAAQLALQPLASESTAHQSSVADTLQSSRERVAARWFALKGVFEQSGHEEPEAVPVRQKQTRTPVLAVFSLAGGVGKTSLVATIGRALSAMGEKVLLTDTTSHGLLPFYFGASELRQGIVRTFSPPSGSTDAPIYLVGYDVEQKGSDKAAQESLVEEIVNSSRGTHRILLDLNSGSSWIVRQMARMNPTVLVPVAPDMNSVISLQFVEKFFHGISDADGRSLQPFYVLNQFDPSLPLHLDVREVLRRQLGDRLLPFVIRRAPSISEALAEGMTIVDYAPDTPVAEDYLNVATWLRTVAAPASAGFRNVRWSER